MMRAGKAPALTGLFVSMVGAGLAFAAARTISFHSSGEPLDGGQFRSDTGFEVLDWNEDGKADLFVHDSGSTGKGYAYFNEGTREAPRFGHGIGQPYNSTETTPQTIEHVQSRAYCDLNHDGLMDVIFFDGQLRYCPNTGSAHAPFWWKMWTNSPAFFPGTESMIRENARFSTGPESMYWNKGIFPRQVVTFTAADWDGDGLQDLLICRTKDEAPGVKPLKTWEQWTPWGRTAIKIPADPGTGSPDPAFLAPLKEPPARGLYFYRNQGTKSEPLFDGGLEILTPDGRSIAAPNPVAADVDGDGLLDLVSTEAPIRCNAFRVDWPTRPEVVWHRRAARADVSKLQAATPLKDAAGVPVPGGTMVRLADFRGSGPLDVLVSDTGFKGTIRWYRNTAGTGQPLALAPATVLRGRDFLRFEFMVQPLVVDWFRPGSRDLIVQGETDHHCKWGLRRTALYRNVSSGPDEQRYERVGWFNFNGDPAMAPVRDEERQYEAYGSSLSVFPDDGTGKKRLMMSVGGRVYFFSDLAPDGLTFRAMKQIEIAQTRNRLKGWQEIPVTVPFKIKAIRIGNDRNGMGNQRDSLLHVLRFEALSGGRNVALSNRVTVSTPVSEESKGKPMVERALNMLDPDNTNTETKLMASSWGFYKLAADITWPEPVRLDAIRFLLSNRDSRWYEGLVPFYWQGKLYRMGMEENENWYQYTVSVSPDGIAWTNLVNRMETEMLAAHPFMVDWDKDGKIDMLLGSISSKGIWPSKKKFRLFRNVGTNDDPKFADPVMAADGAGKPIEPDAHWYRAYAPQCGLVPCDLNGDGKPDLVVEAGVGDELDYYENISSNTLFGFSFKKSGSLKTETGVLHPGGGYRYFDIADADGDGVLDVLNSTGEPHVFKGQAEGSPRSPAAPPVAAPPNGIVLRNGPADGDRTPAYSNCIATTLDAARPDTNDVNGAALKVLALIPNGEKQKVALVRFGGLPPTPMNRAELALYAPGPMTAMMSCNAVDGSGDFLQATWSRAPSGKAWEADALDRGGVFQSFAWPVFQAAPVVRVAWDVTPAVREALKAGRDSVSFVIRLDYTGHYVAGAGKAFFGNGDKNPTYRPQLVLAGELER